MHQRLKLDAGVDPAHIALKVVKSEAGSGNDRARHQGLYMHSVRPTNMGVLTKTPSGGGDMEVQKAMLGYYVVTSNVCLHNS